MRSKFLALPLVGLFVFFQAPTAIAADLPVLTWERGKVHNITLGGYAAQNWQIVLHANNSTDLLFEKSKPNKRGFVVFSKMIPSDFPTGNYFLQASQNASSAKYVAGIHVVELVNYNLVQIPIKLISILLVMIALISMLSTIRMRKYQQIQYLREIRDVDFPNIIGRIYRLRSASVESIRKSLFKFLITREGELLHKLSPVTWAISPLIAAALGSYIGASTRLSGGVSHVSVFLFLLTSVIGIFDPYSGFMASAGFAFSQTILGNVSGIRSLMGLFVVGVAWVAPGIISSLLKQMLEKDGYVGKVSKYLPDIFASILGAAVFITAAYLTNSFTNHIGSFGVDQLYIPAVMGVLILIRIKSEKFAFRNIHIGSENYQIRTLTLSRVVSPRTTIFTSLFTFGIVYLWTSEVKFAVIASILLAIPKILLLVRFDRPVIKNLIRIERNIALEIFLLCTIAFGLFMQIQSLPLSVDAQGKEFVLTSAAILIAHGLYSSVADIADRKQE